MKKKSRTSTEGKAKKKTRIARSHRVKRETVDTVRAATQKILGDDFDVSHITEEFFKSFKKGTRHKAVVGVEYDGSSLHVEGAYCVWHPGCDPTKTVRHKGSVQYRRLPNCANGLLHYKITPQ